MGSSLAQPQAPGAAPAAAMFLRPSRGVALSRPRSRPAPIRGPGSGTEAEAEQGRLDAPSKGPAWEPPAPLPAPCRARPQSAAKGSRKRGQAGRRRAQVNVV